MDLLAAILGRSGNDNVNGLLTSRLDVLDDPPCGVQAGRQGEKHLVIRIVEARERGQVFFQPRFIALAGTDHGDDRRIKPGMRPEPPPYHLKPLKTVPKRVQTNGNLQDHEDVEDFEHCRENNKNPSLRGQNNAASVREINSG